MGAALSYPGFASTTASLSCSTDIGLAGAEATIRWAEAGRSAACAGGHDADAAGSRSRLG